jgi:hypothetical protein
VHSSLRAALLVLRVCLASLGSLAVMRRTLRVMRGEQAPPVRYHVTRIIAMALRVFGMAIMLPATRDALARWGLILEGHRCVSCLIGLRRCSGGQQAHLAHARVRWRVPAVVPLP